jgi:hypothetical protein
MKKSIQFILVMSIILITSSSFAQKVAPYIKVGTSTSSVKELTASIKESLASNNFIYLGQYSPEGKSNLKVITFTSKPLMNTTLKVKDRGALAAVLKIALVKKGSSVTISYLNPDYLFNAYLRSSYDKYATTLKKVATDLKSTLSTYGSDFTGFGGGLSKSDLRKYHYKIMMPYFTDPIKLKTFSSFEEGVKIIKQNLANKKGDTKKVYELVFKNSQVAVFGVALTNKSDGEAYFLPVIGEENIAAMPYQIIIQGNKATMLHGKYGLAVLWPELSMGTFMKIMSTPGYIEDTLEGLTE